MSSGTRELADRLHSAAIHLLRRVRRSDPLTGVSAAQLSALSVLMAGPRTIGELAAAEQVRPPTITRLVQEMERRGLVVRDSDPSDARVARIRWTAKGQRVLQRGRELRITAVDARLRTLPAAEIALLERAVGIIERVVRDDHSSLHGRKGNAR
jgi:DNA-binding MarR family transcriptional regulator